MLKADEVNFLLDSLFGELRSKIPTLWETVLGGVQGVCAVGTHGSLILGGLFVGALPGKVTLIFEWETALRLASGLLNVTKLETFTEDAQLALEEVFKTAMEKTAEKLSLRQGKTELCLLPTLTDANVLLSLHSGAEVIGIEIETAWEPIHLYLAFPSEQQKSNEATSNAA